MAGDSVCEEQAPSDVIGAYVGPNADGKWKNIPPACAYQIGHKDGHSWEYDRCKCEPSDTDIACTDRADGDDGLCDLCRRTCG